MPNSTSEKIRAQSENILIAFSSQSRIYHKIPIGFLDLKILLDWLSDNLRYLILIFL